MQLQNQLFRVTIKITKNYRGKIKWMKQLKAAFCAFTETNFAAAVTLYVQKKAFFLQINPAENMKKTLQNVL